MSRGTVSSTVLDQTVLNAVQTDRLRETKPFHNCREHPKGLYNYVVMYEKSWYECELMVLLKDLL